MIVSVVGKGLKSNVETALLNLFSIPYLICNTIL